MVQTKILGRVPEDRERRAAARMTGRYLVTLQKEAQHHVSGKLASSGFQAAKPLPPGAVAAKAMPKGAQIMLPNVGVAVVDPKPEQEETLQTLAREENAIIALEPEQMVRAIGIDSLSDYMRGWKDAVDALAGKLTHGDRATAMAAASAEVEALATWGLSTTRVINSRFTGAGIKLAVLDTGLDTAHPDFEGRQIVTKNFVGDNAPFRDVVGHGTHCIGTASGPLHSLKGQRYGVAYQAQIFAGRVLDDNGEGGDFNVMQGIDWAIEQNCDLVSLSLGAPWYPGAPVYRQAYEEAAQRALAANCLLIVAAGNEADDPRYVGAVGSPGNCPSVLTVAAIDRELATATFSNRVRPNAPGVKGPDVAGPGVEIYSAWPVTRGQYRSESGTSMATPHVAGIAALYAQANPGVRGKALKALLIRQARALPNGSMRIGEIGGGLVQAS